MAKVRLTRAEIDRGLLPKVCALTGEPTEDSKRKTFVWLPAWVGVLFLAGLLPYLIVGMLMRKSMTVHLPLVRAKHGHWAVRTAVGWGLIALSLVVLITGFALGTNNYRDAPNSPQATVGGVMFAVGIVGFLVALIVAVVLNQSCISPAEITDNDITLVGVHRNFRDAVEDDRDREYEEYQRERDRDLGRRRDDGPIPRARRADEDDRRRDDRPRYDD